MARQTLEQWIREVLIDPDKDGPCTAITLVHMSGLAEKELHTTRFGAKQWEPKELSALFRGKAENYAADIAGVQTFNLLAFYNNSAEASTRKPFTIQGQTDYGGLTTEPPTKEGQAMQGMRHMEAVIQLAFRQTTTLFEQSNRHMEAMAAMNMKLAQENREAFDIVKELMIKQIEGDHTRRMEALEFERRSQERAKWLGMAPALVNTLTGRNIFPQGSSDTALIDTLIDSLDDNAIQQLSGVIKPEIWGALAQRTAQRMKQRRMSRDAEDAAIQGNSHDIGAEH